MSNGDPVVKAYIEQIVAYLTQIWAVVSSKKAWTLRAVYMAIADVVVFVEAIARDSKVLTGEQRRDAAVQALNQVINIPVLPEFLERRLFGILVDAIVQTLNRFLGHEWINRVLNRHPVIVDVPPIGSELPADELIDLGAMAAGVATARMRPASETMIPIEGVENKAADSADDQPPGTGEGVLA